MPTRVSLDPVSNHPSPELGGEAAALASRINAGENALLVFEVEVSSEVAISKEWQVVETEGRGQTKVDAAAVGLLQMIFQQGGRSQRRLLLIIVETVRHRTEEKLLGEAVVLLGDVEEELAQENFAEQEAAKEAAKEAARQGGDETEQVVDVGGGQVDHHDADQKVAQQDQDGQRFQVDAAHHDAAHQDSGVDQQADRHQDDDQNNCSSLLNALNGNACRQILLKNFDIAAAASPTAAYRGSHWEDFCPCWEPRLW
ncbi:hypothetical protein TYRP_023287 [Tyrophagus putrescentiae]|nr:hypothetical protein TYRP_023287 [Tyrophagus putrescentiae]